MEPAEIESILREEWTKSGDPGNGQAREQRG
jgi:hypothetical protein